MTHEFLILPGSVAWDIAMAELPLPPNFLNLAHQYAGEVVFAPRLNSSGILEPMTIKEAEEYVNDGEYDLLDQETEEDGYSWNW